MIMEVEETARKYERAERSGRYTYADYASWDDENRYELIDGVAFMMSAPSMAHQTMITEMLRQLANFLRGKQCRVLVAPFDVCLNARGDEDDTVVQPDLLVVCDDSKLDKKRCNGAPDLIIEIVSPSSSRHDRFRKLNKYLFAGVREYWIVDPDDKILNVHVLENGKYVIGAFGIDDSVPVHVLEGCEINLSEVFAD